MVQTGSMVQTSNMVQTSSMVPTKHQIKIKKINEQKNGSYGSANYGSAEITARILRAGTRRLAKN